MKKLKREIADFYKKIFSNAVFKNKIQEKAKKVVTEKDLRNLIREEIMPLIKKENLNYSEEDLLKYEEETLKSLSKEDLANVSGGLSFKSALWAGGILSMALFGSLNANAMEVDPFASNPQQTRGNSQQQNNSNNNNSNANQPGNNGNNNNGDGNNAANNPDRARAWRNTLYGLLNKLPPSVQEWASPLIEKGLIVSDSNYLFIFDEENRSISPLLPPDVTVLVFPPMVWDVNENVHHVNCVDHFVDLGSSELAKITEFIADPSVKNLTIARRCFADNKNLGSVELQNVESLTIEEGAFDGCENLSKFITCPKLKNLTIPRQCFANNKTLKSVDLRSVENLIIEEGAFDGCENLVELILPENPTNVSIKENAFAGCSALDKTLLVEKYGYVEPSANINFKNRLSDDNFSPISDAYSKNAVFREFESRLSDDVKNSEGFREATKTGSLLKSGEFLLSFDPDLFLGFSRIYLYVPDDVSEITINAEAWDMLNGDIHHFLNYGLERIYGGKNLKKINLGSDIKNFKFGLECCENLEALQEVDASCAYNLEVNLFAFRKCKNLKKFTGAENTEIIDAAFLDCTSLCEVRLPVDASVADDAFKGCTSFRILPLEKNDNNNNAYKENKIQPTKEDLDEIISRWEATLSEEIKGNAYFKGIKNLVLNVYETYLETDEAKGMLTDLKKVLLGNQKNISIGADESFSTLYIFDKKTGKATPILSPEVTKLIISSSLVDIEGKTHDITLNNNILGDYWDGPGKLKNLKELVVKNVQNFTFDSYCFLYSKNLEKVDVSGVVNLIIEGKAFRECQKLYKVNFSGVVNLIIMWEAFKDCQKLSEVNINAKNNINIFSNAFFYCYNLKQVNLSAKNNINIFSNAFFYCYNLKQVNLSAQTIDIGENSFWNCTNLEKVTFAGGGVSIGLVAFRKCLSLEQIKFTRKPESLYIAASAFDCCKNFKDPEFKKLCNSFDIPQNAFLYSGLEEPKDNQNVLTMADEGNNNDVNNKNDEYYVDIDEIMASQKRKFGENPQMRVLDRNAAMDMANGKIPCISKNSDGKIIFVVPIWCDVIEGRAFDYSHNIANSKEQAHLKKMIESVEILVVPPNVKEIGGQAFCGWPNLKKIIFIDGWPQLHGNSFARCPQLRKVESIGDSSNRPDVAYSTSYNPFTCCHNLEEVDIGDNVIYASSITADTDDYEDVKKLKKISMPKRIQIDISSWSDYSSCPIEKLIFPDGTSCKRFRISNWYKLKKLDVPVDFNEESSENELVINRCDSIEDINIRGDVRAINVMTSDCRNNVVSIKECPKLEEVTFPPSLEYVGGSFCDLKWDCPNLKKITFLSERIYFEKEFFDIYTVPNGFKICLPYTKEIYVGDKKYDIPNDNPDNAIEIVKIDYNEKDNYDKEVRITYNKKRRCFVFQKVLDKKDAELMLNGSIPGYYEETGLFKIPEYYCEIVEGAFKNNSSIEIVDIPYSVKKIGKETFANCDNLRMVVVKHRIPNFGNKAFDGCSNLEEVKACEKNSKETTPEQNLADVFSNCPKFKGILVPGEWDKDNDIIFVTIEYIKGWKCKGFGGIIISDEKVYFEKGFFSSEYFPEGFKIYLLDLKEIDSKEICVDCEKISITKEGNSSKDNSDEEDKIQYKVGGKIPLPENISSSGVSSEEEEEEEALEKGIILIKTNPEKEKGLNPTSNPILKYGWRIESYSD